ncbi:MAG TPA: hypothetical protein VFW84_03120 [Aquabacterium sp.]|uniref:hypothetical protein n=1 Tax=Aquabacterium sp. TaxID=1872578 RepID=UPI002E314B52|nr:hypothetical protein [Aquabacterium sp.]HEX5371705.1 hypothetical protein [Aquabacterium sp.]
MAVIVFLLVALASALVWHRQCARRTLAVVGATVTTVLAFQALAYLHLGHVDPFFVIAMAVSSVPAALISLAVGLLMRKPGAAHSDP